MKEILIASFDMEVGGVERSLIGILNNFDYENNKVDLMLYRHKGDFMKLLPNNYNLLNEISDLMNQQIERKNSIILEKVIQYVEEHYNEDITLSDIADKLHINY